MHKSVVGLAKTFTPSFKNDQIDCPNQLLQILVFFKIVKIVLSETVARLKESL